MNKLSQLRRRDASPGLVLAIVCAAVVLASLDLFIVNVALPSIARDLHQPNLGVLSWVLNGYAIVYAALLVLFGRISEGRPREIGFLIGVTIFTLSSAACGLTDSAAGLIVFRVIQAAGAALLTPTSLSLLLATTPAEKRHGAVRTWTAVGGAAAALGPVVGGLLVALSWRWVFFVNVPVGLLALYFGWTRLPHVPGHAVKRPDAVGALLITAGVGLLSLGLVQSNSWGWGSAKVVGTLIAAVVMLVLFVLRLLQHHNPLIDPELFKVRTFSGSAIVSLTFSIAFGAMLLSVVLWMQDVWGWSALQTGLAFAPGPLMVPFFGLLFTGPLIARFGPGKVIAVGSTIYAAGVAWWALRASVEPNYLGQVLPGTICTGIGVGLTLPTFMATGTSKLPPQAFATGSAVINMLRQVGLAVGVAIFIAVVGSPHGGVAAQAAFRHGWEVISVTALIAAAVGLVVLRRPVAAAQPEPAAIAEDQSSSTEMVPGSNVAQV
jgi:EmrB/QacA subfamily drug resistance transporter